MLLAYHIKKRKLLSWKLEEKAERIEQMTNFFSSCDLDQLFSSKHTHTQNTIRFVQLMRIKFLVKRDWKGVDCVKVSKVSKFLYFLFFKIFLKKLQSIDFKQTQIDILIFQPPLISSHFISKKKRRNHFKEKISKYNGKW